MIQEDVKSQANKASSNFIPVMKERIHDVAMIDTIYPKLKDNLPFGSLVISGKSFIILEQGKAQSRFLFKSFFQIVKIQTIKPLCIFHFKATNPDE